MDTDPNEATPWWTLLRSMDDGGEQDGIVRTIDGVDHIYGCVRDRRCLNPAMDHATLGTLCCDCPCHNGGSLQGRPVLDEAIEERRRVFGAAWDNALRDQVIEIDIELIGGGE